MNVIKKGMINRKDKTKCKNYNFKNGIQKQGNKKANRTSLVNLQRLTKDKTKGIHPSALV